MGLTSTRSSMPPPPSPSGSCASIRVPAWVGSLPVDPFYLTWKAREYDFATEFIELAGKVNQHAPYVSVERVERALNDLVKAGQGLPRRDPRRRATRAEIGDIARVAGAADHEGARRAGRRAVAITTHMSPRCPSFGLRQRAARRSRRRCRRRRPRDRPSGHRLRQRSPGTPRCSSTCAA